MQNTCLITIDVEEWFQVENLRSAFPKEAWKDQQSTVKKNTIRILNACASLKYTDFKNSYSDLK